jgi:hypothetical protein
MLNAQLPYQYTCNLQQDLLEDMPFYQTLPRGKNELWQEEALEHGVIHSIAESSACDHGKRFRLSCQVSLSGVFGSETFLQ